MGAIKATTVYDADVLTTANATVDVSVSGAESMVVAWTITDSGASGDLGTTTVKTYTATDSAAPVLIDNAITGTSMAATTRVAPVTTKLDRYDVRGLQLVQLKMNNASGSTRRLKIYVYLYS